MQFTVVLMGLVASVLATPNANAEPAVTPAAEVGSHNSRFITGPGLLID